jgi:hypothetical protein
VLLSAGGKNSVEMKCPFGIAAESDDQKLIFIKIDF